jgi:predicted small integral membrane protein
MQTSTVPRRPARAHIMLRASALISLAFSGYSAANWSCALAACTRVSILVLRAQDGRLTNW